jgi:hypothetical protein
MVYPGTFGRDPVFAVNDAFNSLAQYAQPVTVWLQSHSLESANILLDAASTVFDQHGDRAEGLVLWRYGSDVMGDMEFEAAKQLVVPSGRTTPRPNPDPKKQEFTNQQLINAFAAAAAAQGVPDDYWQWVISAGLESIANARTRLYSGTPILNLPGLSADQKSLIQRALDGENLSQPINHDDEVAKYTNQQVINAFAEAARLLGVRDSYWNWIVQAGLENLASDRSAAYSGPLYSQLPNLSQEQKTTILNVLLAEVPLAIVVADGQVKLPVPWKSQMDSSGSGNGNCGQAALAMLMKYLQKTAINTNNQMVPVTFERLIGRRSGKTGAADLDSLAQHFNMPELHPDFSFVNADSLRAPLDAKCPVILLVNYLDLNLPNHLFSGNDQGWHWILVVGYDSDGYFFHDPLWLPSQEAQASYIHRSRDVLNGAMIRIGGQFQALYTSPSL